MVRGFVAEKASDREVKIRNTEEQKNGCSFVYR